MSTEAVADDVVNHDGRDVFGLTEALCAVESVSGNEGPLTDAIELRLRARASGLHTERIANNIVARTDLGRAKRILLGGHIDTVPVNANFPPHRDGDVIHGVGSADMKGGLASMLAVAELIERTDPTFDVTLLWYEGEEVADEHNGLRHLFDVAPELVACDLAILLEPTGGWLEAGCQGTIHARASFRGERAHTARPWMGVNAVHRAAGLLGRLAAFDAAVVDVDGLPYREALQVVRIEGGVANNVVPDRCSLVVNRRYAPNRSLDEAVGEFVALLDEADEVEVIGRSPAAPPNLFDPLIAQFVGVHDLGVRPKLGWTDVARFASRGIPACNFGPGDPTIAHTRDERVDRADVEGCHRILAHFLGLSD